MKKILIVLSLLILASCTDTMVSITPNNVKRLVREKESTKRDVLNLFGDPNEVSKNSDGNDLWLYTRMINGNDGRTFMIIFDDYDRVDKFIVY